MEHFQTYIHTGCLTGGPLESYVLSNGWTVSRGKPMHEARSVLVRVTAKSLR